MEQMYTFRECGKLFAHSMAERAALRLSTVHVRAACDSRGRRGTPRSAPACTCSPADASTAVAKVPSKRAPAPAPTAPLARDYVFPRDGCALLLGNVSFERTRGWPHLVSEMLLSSLFCIYVYWLYRYNARVLAQLESSETRASDFAVSVEGLPAEGVSAARLTTCCPAIVSLHVATSH